MKSTAKSGKNFGQNSKRGTGKRAKLEAKSAAQTSQKSGEKLPKDSAKKSKKKNKQKQFIDAGSSNEVIAGKVFDPKNIAVMYRPGTDAAIREANQLSQWLSDEGFTVYACPGQKLNRIRHEVSDETLDQIDWVIALGGDGTYLRAARMLDGRQVPILGINMGSLGFLTEIRQQDLMKTVRCTLEGKMEFQPRSMLRVEVRRNDKVKATYLALNDAVLERGSNTHLINLEIYSQQHLVAQMKADALIVASPTGSTAYNLAAGGPILHPQVRAIVVTPVCPHALTSRPLIFPDHQKLSFRILADDRRSILTVDGMGCGEITIEDEVTVVRHESDHYVIRKPGSNYFSLLRQKLSFGQRD